MVDPAAIRILVADDHDVVRRGICELLTRQAGWNVCGEVCDGVEAVEKARELNPDLVIVDLGMPRLNGLEASVRMLQDNPKRRIIVLSVHDSPTVMDAIVRAGVKGYVSKADAANDLVEAVKAVLAGTTYFNSGMSEMLLSGYLGRNGRDRIGRTRTLRHSPLSDRERQVIRLIVEGKTSKEVASALAVSPKTIETHRTNIMRKMGFHSVPELVIFAVRTRIVDVSTTSVASADLDSRAANPS